MCLRLDSNQHALTSTTPSRWQVYQCLHVGILNQKSDPGGPRTHDPNIKSVVLYQLSYRVCNKMTTKHCDLAGARTQDPNIKSVVLYQLSYQVLKFLYSEKEFIAGAKLRIFFRYTSKNSLFLHFIFIIITTTYITIIYE